MIEVHRPPSADTLTILASLQEAVRKCLERKRRLGQYAIVWRDGKPERLTFHSSEDATSPANSVDAIMKDKTPG